MIGPPALKAKGAAPDQETAPANRRLPQDCTDPNIGKIPTVESELREALGKASVEEALLYGAAFITAERGIRAPTNPEVMEMLSWRSSDSMPATTFARLAKRELIQNFPYQRGRVVIISATGKRSATPRCQAPHWRHRGGHRHG